MWWTSFCTPSPLSNDIKLWRRTTWTTDTWLQVICKTSTSLCDTVWIVILYILYCHWSQFNIGPIEIVSVAAGLSDQDVWASHVRRFESYCSGHRFTSDPLLYIFPHSLSPPFTLKFCPINRGHVAMLERKPFMELTQVQPMCLGCW